MKETTMQDLLDRILCADTRELRCILDAVMERFSELFPDQELLTLAVPGSDPDRQIAALQQAIALLSNLNKK